MKLNNRNTIRLEDYPDTPEWFQKFAENYNQFVDFLYIALNKNLDELNINQAFVNYTVTPSSDFPLKIPNKIKGVPKAVFLCQREQADTGSHIAITSATTVDWFYDGENVVINSISNLTSDTKYNITLLIM